MQEAAELVDSLDWCRAVEALLGGIRDGYVETNPTMRTVLVEVLDVLAEHGFEVTPSEDEHAVEALSPDGALRIARRRRWIEARGRAS